MKTYIVKEQQGWQYGQKFYPPESEIKLTEAEANEFIKAGVKLAEKKSKEQI
jgi:hypothetical protein